MKNHFVRLTLTLTLMFTLLGFNSTIVRAAGLCKNTGCEDKNPSTMQCPATTSGAVKILPDGKSTVETRKSSASDCDAKWARVYNKSGGNRYAAASLRYGCANYCYSKNIRTTEPIASSSTVGIYTMMLAYAATPTRSCGDVSVSPIKTLPISISASYCTGAN